MGDRVRAGTTGVVLTVGAAAATVVLGTWTVGTWPGTGVVPIEQALVTVALAAATLTAGWVLAVLAMATVTVLRAEGPRPPRTEHLPRSVRAACVLLVTLSGAAALPAVAAPVEVVAAAGAVGGTVTVGGAGPAEGAGTPQSGGAASADHPDPAVPQPGWTPTPLTPRPVPHEDVGLVTTVPAETLPDRVVVRRGDTLWDLCARHLGPRATTADIAQEWPRWYDANIGVIGPDPDLILPGQELVVPERGSGR